MKETAELSSWSAAPSLSGVFPGHPNCLLLHCLIPFWTLRPLRWPGSLVLLRSQRHRSSLSCVSCVFCASSLSYVSSPSFFSFSSHWCQHLNSCLGTDFPSRCWASWLVVETHWLSETVRGKQKLVLLVLELQAEGTQIWIWIWRTLFLMAENLEMVSGWCVVLACGTPCGWVSHYVKGSAASAGWMEKGWRVCNVPVDSGNL